MQGLEVPEPDYDDPKEVYAFFGLAYYSVQVLEQGLVNLAVCPQHQARAGRDIGIVPEIYDAMDKKTFGLRLQFTSNQTWHSRLSSTKTWKRSMNKRNYLAHLFYVAPR